MRPLIPLTALLLAAAPAEKVDMAAAILPPPVAPGEAVLPFVSAGEARIALMHDSDGDPSSSARETALSNIGCDQL